MSCPTFIFESATTSVYLEMPMDITWNEGREIKTLHFWAGASSTEDIAKDTEQITMSGTEHSTATSKMADIDDIAEHGDEVTISGFNDTNLDATWVISSFSYTVYMGGDNSATWAVTLERT